MGFVADQSDVIYHFGGNDGCKDRTEISLWFAKSLKSSLVSASPLGDFYSFNGHSALENTSWIDCGKDSSRYSEKEESYDFSFRNVVIFYHHS